MSSHSINRLAYYTVQVLAANLLGGLLIFLQPILILNLTQEHSLGIFSLLVSWANIGMLLASFGLFTALQRLGARYLIRHEQLNVEAYSFLKRASKLNLLIAITILTLVAVSVHGRNAPITLYPAIALAITSIFLTRWYLILARIRGNNFWPNIFDQSLREGLFILFSLPLLYLLDPVTGEPGPSNFDNNVLLLTYSAAAAASAWASRAFAVSRRLVPDSGKSDIAAGSSRIRRSTRNRLRRIWAGIARTSFPSEIGIYLLKRIDVIIVGLLVSTEGAGIYFLMSRIAELPNLLAGAINVVVGPEFAKMTLRGNVRRFRVLYLAAAILPALVTAILITGIWFADQLRWSDWILGRSLDLTVLYVFLAGYIVYFSLGPSSVYLTMTGRQKISSLVTCGIIGFHFLAVTLLTLGFGTVGAAVAFSLSICLQRVVELAIVFFRKTRNPYPAEGGGA